MGEKREIRVGDEVVVYLADSPVKMGIVEATPREGDELWYVRDHNGYLMAFNSKALHFTYMAKQWPDKTDKEGV